MYEIAKPGEKVREGEREREKEREGRKDNQILVGVRLVYTFVHSRVFLSLNHKDTSHTTINKQHMHIITQSLGLLHTIGDTM